MRALAAGAAAVALGLGQTAPPSAAISLRDVAPSSGITLRLENHPTPAKRLIETMTGGLAAFDYDNDGLTDLFFTNGAAATNGTKEQADWNRLYRNQGGLKFTDVTAQAGVGGEGFSMGAAAADFDNDGDVDLFVAGYERNLLYRNTGKGTFENITARSGIHSRVWSVAAGWLDFDRDGLLDLFVVNYLRWSAAGDRFCGDRARDIRVYCHPRHYDGLANTLYRNRGNGTFEDVSRRAGIAQHVGKGMSVAFADYDEDGWLDAFVTNDTLPNFLFRNLGNGRGFDETALLAGTGVSINGKAISSMGVVFRDFDNDGRPDLHVTALAGETFPLFRNDGRGQFSDQTAPTGLARATLRRSGWGNALADLDNDGWKDLFTANSHVNDRVEDFEAHRYREANSVFRNTGSGKFVDISDQIGPDFTTPRAHRGAIAVDLNNDGRLDIVTTALGDRPEIWENVTAGGNRWLQLRLTGATNNRDGIGARIQVGKQMQTLSTADGYSSSVHAPVHFGLGSLQRVDSVEITWPDGKKQVVKDVTTNQVVVIKEQ